MTILQNANIVGTAFPYGLGIAYQAGTNFFTLLNFRQGLSYNPRKSLTACKDISYYKDKIDLLEKFIKTNENQTKNDMNEVKQDLKLIFKSINDVQINFARMEARNEGKDDVINELKNAVTTILKDKK